MHPKLWEGANKKFRKVPRARVEQQHHERVSLASLVEPADSREQARTDKQKSRSDAKLTKRQQQRAKDIKAQGIDYEFKGKVS